MINKVILIGNLGKDPETRTIGDGRQVVNFSIATTESYKDKNGNKVEQTEWHNIEVWNKLADVAAKFLKKGSKVYIEGKIKTEEWEKDGQKRRTTKIQAREIQFLTPKPETNPSDRRQPAASSNGSLTDTDDGLPF